MLMLIPVFFATIICHTIFWKGVAVMVQLVLRVIVIYNASSALTLKLFDTPIRHNQIPLDISTDS